MSTILFLITTQLSNALPEEAWKQALSLRSTPEKAIPHFERTLHALKEIESEGAQNAKLYRAMGNVHFILDQLPEAILSYRRALEHDPTDFQSQTHLRLARERVIYSSKDNYGRPPQTSRPPWLPRFRIQWWMLVVLWLGYVSGWILLTRWRMQRHAKLLWSGIFILVGAVLGGLCLMLMDHIDRPKAPVVVLHRDGMLLRKGDGPRYPAVNPTPLNRGVEAMLLFRRGEWSQVKLGSGEIGWMPNRALSRDR